jgi:hypothetical protein
MLLEDLWARKAAESAQTAKNAELEALVNSQVGKSLSLKQRTLI